MRSKEEEESMTQLIDVKLSVKNEEDILIFKFEKPIEVHLNKKEGLGHLKKVFENILELLTENKVKLIYDENSDNPTVMYQEIVKDYLDDLNKELYNCYENVRDSINGNSYDTD